jgi:hypothetical protein
VARWAGRLSEPVRQAAEWLPMGSSTTTAWAIGGAVGLLISIALLWAGVLPLSFPENDAAASGEDAPKPLPRPVGKGTKRKKSKRGKAGESISAKFSRAPESRPSRDEGERGDGEDRGQECQQDEPTANPSDRPSIGVTVGARREVLKEVLFLLPVLAGGLIWWSLTKQEGPLAEQWHRWCDWPHLAGLGGSLFGLLIGGAIVWGVRIIGTLIAGREAMGLGDVHLLAAAGALLGWTGAAMAFFVSPFFGLTVAVGQWVRHGRRELPFGPYLSLAVLAVLLFYDRLAGWWGPQLRVLFAPGG